MKAAMLKKWGELELTDIKKPVAGKNEALIKVRYGGVCGSDVTVFKGLHMTAKAPVVLCHEILGNIETLPEDYDGPFTVGERVLMNPIISCGECAACKAGYTNVCSNLKLLGIHVNGGFEEFTTVAVDKLVKVDAGLPDKIAVLGEPFAVGFHVNRRSGVRPGDKVFIAGAGTIGLVVGMCAREYGAYRIVVSEINPKRLELARELGFETVNPTEENVMDVMNKVTDGSGFDVVYDASGAKASVLQLPDLCRCRGTIVSLGLSGAAYDFVLGKISFKEISVIGSRLYSQDDFEKGVAMMSSVKKHCDLSRIVTDVMPLDRIKEAMQKMIAGESVSKIIIDCR